MRRLGFIALIVLLSSCTVVKVQETPLSSPQNAPQDAQPSPIGFNKIRYAIPTGTTVAGISVRSIRCPLIMKKMQRGITGRIYVNDTYKRLFNETMESLGYDVTGDPGRLFDEEDMQRTAYAVGARVVDIKMDMCHEESVLFDYDLGVIGEASSEIEWTVFDLLHRRSVYKTTTKGYAELDMPNDEGLELLLENSFAAAAHNLGSDKQFFDLVFYGKTPRDEPATMTDPEEDTVTLFDPQEVVTLPSMPVALTPAKERFEEIVKSAVLIQAGETHGSGFFLTQEGHVLTNAHVVGNAKRVRVVTSGKQEKLIAEVLRKDVLRDVALLKLEKITDDFKPQPLPIRRDKPKVGEEIYAVGSPRLTKLQDTVTHGIISAHRFDRREKQHYMQADVDIYGGNSGGALLDEHGNVIGLSVLGYIVGGADTLGGLNWFIPIGDALEELKITMPDAP